MATNKIPKISAELIELKTYYKMKQELKLFEMRLRKQRDRILSTIPPGRYEDMLVRTQIRLTTCFKWKAALESLPTEIADQLREDYIETTEAAVLFVEKLDKNGVKVKASEDEDE